MESEVTALLSTLANAMLGRCLLKFPAIYRLQARVRLVAVQRRLLLGGYALISANIADLNFTSHPNFTLVDGGC